MVRFAFHGNYSQFLEKKEEIPARAIQASGSAGESGSRGDRMAAARAKARTRKSKARISKAGELMGELPT